MDKNLFEKLQLDEQHEVYVSRIEAQEVFRLSDAQFLALWNLHPNDYHTIKILGKEVLTPRWQQAYGKNYRYTGSKNNALPIPEPLESFLAWSIRHINERLNGLLLNWYDGKKKHYIGAHRDDTRDLSEGSPIVTISLGQERVFRMRPYQGKGFKDISISHGSIIIIPWHTNHSWTHEVPHFKKYIGKRISVTLRAYL